MDEPQRTKEEKLANVRELVHEGMEPDTVPDTTSFELEDLYRAYVRECEEDGCEPLSLEDFDTRAAEEVVVDEQRTAIAAGHEKLRKVFEPTWRDDVPPYPSQDEFTGEVDGVHYRTGPALTRALAACHMEVKTIGFDGKNQGQGYKYATGSAIAVEARRIMNAQGLFLRRWRHEIVDEHTVLVVRSLYQLLHEPSGQSEKPQWFPVPLVTGHGRSMDKALGAALTFSDKYHRQSVLGLDWRDEAEDVDARVEQRGNRPRQQQSQQQPREGTRKTTKQQPAARQKTQPLKGGNNPKYQERVQAARKAVQNSRISVNNAIHWATGLTDLNRWQPGFAPASVYIAVTDFCALYRQRNEGTGLKIESHDQYLKEVQDEQTEPLWRHGEVQDRAMSFDKTLPPNSE